MNLHHYTRCVFRSVWFAFARVSEICDAQSVRFDFARPSFFV